MSNRESTIKKIRTPTTKSKTISTKLISHQLEKVKLNKRKGSIDTSNKHHAEVPKETKVVKTTSFLEKLAAFNRRLDDIERSLQLDTLSKTGLEATNSVPAKQKLHAIEESSKATPGSLTKLSVIKEVIGETYGEDAQPYSLKRNKKLSEDIHICEEDKAVVLDDYSDTSLNLKSVNSGATDFFSLDNSEASLLDQEPPQHPTKNKELNNKSLSDVSFHFPNEDIEDLQATVKGSTETELEAQSAIAFVKKKQLMQESLDSVISSPENENSKKNLSKDIDDNQGSTETKLKPQSEKAFAKKNKLIQESSESIISSPENENAKRNLSKDIDDNHSLSSLIPIGSYSRNFHPSKKLLQSCDRLQESSKTRFSITMETITRETLKNRCFGQDWYLQSDDGIVCYSTELTAIAKRSPLRCHKPYGNSTQIVKSLKLLAMEQQGIKPSTSKAEFETCEKTQIDILTESLKPTTETFSEDQEKSDSEKLTKVSVEKQCISESATVETQDKSVVDTFPNSQWKPYETALETQDNVLKETVKSSLEIQGKSESKTVTPQYKPNTTFTISISNDEQHKPNIQILDSINRGLTSASEDEFIYQLKECAGTTRTNITKIIPGSEEDLLEATKIHKELFFKSYTLTKSSSEVHEGAEKTQSSDQAISKPRQGKQESNRKSPLNKDKVVKKYKKLSEFAAEASSRIKQEWQNWSSTKNDVSKSNCLKYQKDSVTSPEAPVAGKLHTIRESDEKSSESNGRKFRTKLINKQPEQRSSNKFSRKINSSPQSQEEPARQQKKIGKVAAQNHHELPKKDLTARVLQELVRVFSKSALHIKDSAKNIVNGPNINAKKGASKNTLKSPLGSNSCVNNRIITKRTVKNQRTTRETSKAHLSEANQKLGSSLGKVSVNDSEFSCFSKLKKNMHQKDKAKSKYVLQVNPACVPIIVLETATSNTKLKQETCCEDQVSTKTAKMSLKSIKNMKNNNINTSKLKQQLDTVRRKISSAESASSSYSSKAKRVTPKLHCRSEPYCMFKFD